DRGRRAPGHVRADDADPGHGAGPASDRQPSGWTQARAARQGRPQRGRAVVGAAQRLRAASGRRLARLRRSLLARQAQVTQDVPTPLMPDLGEFSFPTILLAVLFGLVGFAAFRYGRKN